MEMQMTKISLTILTAAAFISIEVSRANADELLIADMSSYLEAQTTGDIIGLAPDVFRSLSEVECNGFVEHAGLIVETLSGGKVSVSDLRSIDEEIGRPTLLHDFVERTMGGEEMTTLAGARIVTQVDNDCATAIDYVVDKHSE